MGRVLIKAEVRNRHLRWPVELPDDIAGQRFVSVERRAKYLLLGMETGGLIVHLGMSGSLRLVSNNLEAGKHDHVDFHLDSGLCLRLTDPRRFGSIHWQRYPLAGHWLLKNLGVEPLTAACNGDYLHRHSRGRRIAVKNFIMDAHVVVGVGNIYANEALFRAGVRPRTAAGRISKQRFEGLSQAIKATLARAIELGGTTLRDFVGSDGRPGYFAAEHFVYARAGHPCRICGSVLKGVRSGQRATVYCPKCQR